MNMNSSGTRQALAALLCAAILSQGCAAAMQTRVDTTRRPLTAADRALLADYVQRLPPGTAVKVERVAARTLRGTLMNATAASLVIQPRTRLPEPPVEVPLAEVLTVTPETGNGGSLGRAIAAGVAAGAGAALVTFFVLVAIFSD